MNRIITILLFCAAFLPHCARVASITGGPKDTLPPVVVRMAPTMNTKNFTGRSIVVEFDEYVALKEQQKEFYTSPGMKKIPTVTLRGRGFRIDIHDTLKQDQTYSLNFGSAVTDNHEGNPLNGFRYVFSTGSEIDSLVMSGYAEDAARGDSLSKTFAWFFDAELDSIPAFDSTIFHHQPEVVGRAENNGIFMTQNLKAKNYRVYAVKDENNNQMYDAGVDKIGFLDGTYNPSEMAPFNAVWDTTRNYVVAEPQLYFRMFTDARPARQRLIAPTRPRQNLVVLQFGAPWPRVDSLGFEGLAPERIIREYLKPTRDSIALWLDMSEGLPPLEDTLRGSITFWRPDSLGVPESVTQALKLGWRKSESREQIREREKRERDVAEGRTVEPEPNPFKVTYTQGELKPQEGIRLEFESPLVAVDLNAVTLSAGDTTHMEPIAFKMLSDTMALRKWRVEAEWEPGKRYRFFVPPGALRNAAGQLNDTIVQAYEIPAAARLATLAVDVVGKTPESEYIIQLTDEGGSRILDEVRHARTGRHTFHYVTPGKVRLKITEDVNANGEWNTGNLVARSQPERVEFYFEKGSDPAITVRAGWDETKTVDMNILFAPITIESVRERLAKQEEARLVKLREFLQRQREERARREAQGTGGQSAGSMIQGATGFSF